MLGGKVRGGAPRITTMPVLALDTHPQQQGGREISALCLFGLNKRALDDSFLPIHGVHQGEDKAGSSISHGQSGRTCSSLGLHDFCASLLDPPGECGQLVLGKVNLGGTLQGKPRIV